MNAIAKATGLSKNYSDVRALDNVSFEIGNGRIVGLIGPNGAGKTTALKALLGLTDFRGDLEVLGMDPREDRPRLMHDVCFIADVAVLPRWIRVSQALDFVEGVHPKFSRDKAEKFLATTKLRRNARVRQLSKGMIVQLHLAIVMAIEAKFLVLDEPTLGLDILYRKEFYSRLLNDYFDEERTILVTTHQVEEVENILTDLMFIKDGKLVLSSSMDDVGERFVELMAGPENSDTARNLGPIHERRVFGRNVFLFDGIDRNRLEGLGETHRPTVADLFVAIMQGDQS